MSKQSQLVAALKNLAAPAETQVSYLEGLEVAPSCDELALEFMDALGAPEPSPGLQAALAALEAQLDQMSGQENAPLWHVDALRTAEEWNTVRALANRALQAEDPTS